jgi:predicted O-methyltransferase YrrM
LSGGPATAIRAELALLSSLRGLPRSVAVFHARARWRARRMGDRFTLDSAARPVELAELLAAARGRTNAVELGTGTAWSAISLALGNPRQRVISYDPCVRPERDAYLRLVPAAVRARIELRQEPDSDGPHAGDAPVQLLFVDSSHYRESVLDAFAAWRRALAPGAVVVFHDYGHPQYPGVREAVAQLGLDGEERGGLYVWSAP